jgi:hypothetical protein
MIPQTRQHTRNQRVLAVSHLFTLAILIVSLTMAPLIAYAEGSAQIVVGSSGQVQAGEEFTLPVNIQDNPGIAGATFVIHYDGNALELTNITGEGGILGSGIIANVAEDTIGYLTFPGDNTKNGLLFNVTFKVRDAVESGDYEITVGLKDNLDKNLVNGEAQAVPVSFAAGMVAIDGVASDDTGDNPGGVNNPSNGNSDVTPPGTITTGDGTEVTDSIDVKASGASGPKQVSVGTSFFVNAEEGSLSWDSDVLEGFYDASAGGYVLTPTKPGDTALTYQDENGNKKSIELTINDVTTPRAEDGSGTNPIIFVLIIAAVIVVAVVIFIMLQHRKSVAAAGKHRTSHARR